MNQPDSDLSAPLAPQSPTETTPRVTVLAKDLKLQTLQGLTVSQDQVIVPTLEGQLLQVTPDGTTSVLVDLLKAELGIPYGMNTQDGTVIATVSSYDPLHYLVAVKADGSFSKIADLTEISGVFGAPFGVAVDHDRYVVAGSTDVVSGEGLLYAVSPQGEIAKLVDLKEFGNSFSIVVHQKQFFVTQEKGQLLRIRPDAKTEPVSILADLIQAGLGHPFGLAGRGEDLFVSLGSGWIITVDMSGKISTLVNLLPNYGVPSGLAVLQDQLIVATNSGYLLQIQV
jgi:hypothetical protein